MANNDFNQQELVLIVDNDPGVKDLTRDFLELYGHSVITADNKVEALALCKQRGSQISVVLLDVVVSETAALDFFQQIQEINPAAKVIITSIYSHDWDSGDVFNRGAAGFLKKPYRMTDLLRMVERVQGTQ